MFKYRFIVLIVLSAFVWALAGVNLRLVNALDPTIPTRTPTPDPNQPPPSPTDDGSSDPGDPPPPQPTSPTQPTATSTPAGALPGSGTTTPTRTTQPAAGAVSPPQILGGTVRANPGGLGSCSDTPYVQSIGLTIIYRGPGSSYDPVSTLQPGEMRPIVGRAQFAQWWQIWLDSGPLGWVEDVEVNEFGNTALVPVVAPPANDGATPTPGALWNPTPLPLLTCVPTPTPTNTPTGMPTATGAAPGALPGSDDGGEDPDATATPEMVLADVGPTPVVATPAPEVDSSTAAGKEADIQGTGLGSRGADASRAAAPTSATNLILPLAGLGLIAGGIVMALFSRSKGGKKPDAAE